MKYPYSLDGLVGFMPKINIFFSSKFDLFLLIAVYSISNLALRENMAEFDKALSNINDIENIK